MKALRLLAPGQLVVEDVPVPEPGEDEVLIRIEGSGICGTDLHMLLGHNLHRARYPITPGHESYGTVAGFGTKVTHLNVGEYVAIDPAVRCETCPECLRGRSNLCDNKGGYGIGRDGGFAEYAVVRGPYAVPVPAAVDPQHVVLAEPLACVIHALDRLGPVAGESVLILGAGPIGLILSTLVARAGAGRVSVIDRNTWRLGRAQQAFGADDTATDLNTLTAPRGWDVVIDASGSVELASAAFAVLAKGGRFLLMGVTDPGREVRIETFELLRKEQTVLSTVSVLMTVSRALDVLASGVLPAADLLTGTVGLADASIAIRELGRGEALKTVVRAH